MGKHAQLLQQEDVVVLSAVLHEARAAALASSTSTAMTSLGFAGIAGSSRVTCPFPS